MVLSKVTMQGRTNENLNYKMSSKYQNQKFLIKT